MSFVIATDSSANLTDVMIEKYRVEILSLTYTLNGKEYLGYEKGKPTDFKSFYDEMRAGAKASTSCINEETAYEYLRGFLERGEDVLFLVFSSGLSLTCENVQRAAKRLSKEFPERKVYCVDSLCESMGLGMLVAYCALERDKGKSIDEVRDFAENTKLRINHIFTVDDLAYLKRGGRVSASTAVIASVLKIKPVLCMDEQGKLVSKANVIGRKAAIKALFNKFMEKAENKSEQIIFISHGDCRDDADALAAMVEKSGVKSIDINYIDQVIGSHSGPGTLAIFFLAADRKFK